MQIRQLGAADAAPYHALRLRMLQLYPDAFTSSYEEDVAKPLSWVKERLAPVRGGPGFVLGAYSGVDIVGAVGIEVEERRKQRHKALLFGMYVAPEHAGHGAGRALLAECVARARRVDGLEQLYLTVTTSNDRAVRLYERAGFRVFGVEQHALKIGGEYFAKSHMVLCLQDLRLQEPC
jgi:ribosomal protein S18 acetylase RimI-like enzyme